jgi:hypothetical protein
MKKLIGLSLSIWVFAVSAQELVEFENGKVANADDINANFTALQAQIKSLQEAQEGQSFSSVQCPEAPYDMVAYWSFDTSIADLSGGMGEMPVGQASLSSGKFSSSLNLTNDGDYLVIPDRRSLFFLNDEAFSISLWFKPMDDQSGFVFLKNAAYGIQWNGSQNALQFYNGSYHVGTRTDWTLGEWYHLVLIDDGHHSVSLYVNGELESRDQERSPNRFRSRADNLVIFPTVIGGWFEDGYSDEVNGLIDDLAFFNRSLSDEEVAGVYGSEKSLCSVPAESQN